MQKTKLMMLDVLCKSDQNMAKEKNLKRQVVVGFHSYNNVAYHSNSNNKLMILTMAANITFFVVSIYLPTDGIRSHQMASYVLVNHIKC